MKLEDDDRVILLLHGAGSGPWIFDSWTDTFDEVAVVAVDLLEGLSTDAASMNDYCDRVLDEAKTVDGRLLICGWSMGGLVALMAAQRTALSGLILMEPSPPGQLQGFDDTVDLLTGTFDPEAAYGRFPEGVRSRPESLSARSERKRGISVPNISCPALVISGDEFKRDRGEPVARFYGAKHLHFPGLDHWDLVRHPEVRAAVGTFINTVQ